MLAEQLYFAYGSNLNLAQMHKRCATAMAERQFSINNWKLVFRDVADIEPCQGASVDGALYRVTDIDVAALDLYEGVINGLYRRVSFRIRETGELAFFYRMNDDYVYPPSKVYFNSIIDGYGDWQIPLRGLNTALIESWEMTHEQDHMANRVDGATRRSRRDNRGQV